MAETKRFGLIGFSVPMYDAQGVREYVAGVDDSNDQVIDDILARLDSNDEALSELGEAIAGKASTSDTTLNWRGFGEWVVSGIEYNAEIQWTEEPGNVGWSLLLRMGRTASQGDSTSTSLTFDTYTATRPDVDSEWTVTPATSYYGVPAVRQDGNGAWYLCYLAGPYEAAKGDANSTVLTFSSGPFYPATATATRSVLSYVLGSQTDKPLQPELSAPVRGSVADIQTRINQLSADATVDANVKALILGLYAALGIVPTA